VKPVDPVPGRLERLRLQMDRKGVKAVLVQSPENRRYFSGFKAPDAMFTESAGALVITLDGGNWLLTDGRFTEAARKEAPLFTIVTCSKGLAKGVREEGLAREHALHFEPRQMSVHSLMQFADSLGKARMKALPFSLGDFRVVKSEDELHLIRRAVAITEKSLSLLWEELEPGVSENWAAQFLEEKFKALGGEGAAFPSIVASGANAALPHAEPSNKKFGKTEMVVIDIGARYKGYCADMTRTWMPHRPADWQKEIYFIVREAQERAIAALGPGRTGAEVDRVARDYIASKGYGQYFNHSLGHGVGLLVHEEPRLSQNSQQPLPVGSLVTVEPGIYLPDRGGVRLEQLCAITEDGCSVLNTNKLFYNKFL
jgi:Xaa-Pro aminopeptidase